MIKPEVRVTQNQEITTSTDVNINSPEAYALMMKYNISQYQAQPQIQETPINDPNRDLSFEQMLAMEENKIRAEKQRAEMLRQQELNKPQPYSFDRRNVNYHDTQFKSLDDTGFGIQIQVVSDMPINKGYGY